MESNKRNFVSHRYDEKTIPILEVVPVKRVTNMNLKEFIEIKRQLLENNKLYEDPEFPPVQESMYHSGHRNDLKVIWMRPFEMVDKPQMFVDGPTRWDIIQGSVGDCWFISALASLCSCPRLIERIIPDSQTFYQNYCGMFYIRFWQFGQWVTVVVDDRLPYDVNRKQLVFIRSFRKAEFWSSIVEKAYAKFYGCYENLHGGRPSSGLLDLTGGLTEWYPMRSVPNNFYTRLCKFSRSNCILSCGIAGTKGRGAEEKITGNLLSQHSYSITDVKQVEFLNKNGDLVRYNLLRIKNPWGQVEWQGPWSKRSHEWKNIPSKKRLSLGLKVDEDGEFWMCYEDFKKHFTDLYVCSVEPHMLGDRSDPAVGWTSIMFLGEWNFEISAETNILHSATIKFWQYQQFKVELRDVDLYDHDMKCELVVSLVQRSQRFHRKLGIPMLPIGYYIFRLEKENQRFPLNDNFFRHHNPVGISRMSDSQEVACRFRFSPGSYIVIPVTSPHKRGEFLLRMCYEKRVNVWGHVIMYGGTGKKHGALEDFGWNTSTIPKLYTIGENSSLQSVIPSGVLNAKPIQLDNPPVSLNYSKKGQDVQLQRHYSKPPKLVGNPEVIYFGSSCPEHLRVRHTFVSTNDSFKTTTVDNEQEYDVLRLPHKYPY